MSKDERKHDRTKEDGDYKISVGQRQKKKLPKITLEKKKKQKKSD